MNDNQFGEIINLNVGGKRYVFCTNQDSGLWSFGCIKPCRFYVQSDFTYNLCPTRKRINFELRKGSMLPIYGDTDVKGYFKVNSVPCL